MSSTQKRGFRLRWAADRDPDEGGAAQATIDARAPDMRAGAKEDAVDEGVARLTKLLTPAVTKDAAPAAPAASAAPETTVEAEMIATDTEPEGETKTATEDAAANGAWPSSDRSGAAQHAGDVAARPAIRAQRGSSVPRRDNPLVAGLVKAMREAAIASRDETTNRLQGEATARIEAIRAEATTDGASLRKRVDDDIAGIREWSKGEMARIRQETEVRIEARRADAIAENKRHLDGVERLVDEVQTTVSAFEADMDQFFGELLAETDPATLATLAEQAPDPPDLTGDPPKPSGWDLDAAGAAGDASAVLDEFNVLEADAAAEAEAEATEGLDMGADARPAGALAATRRGDTSTTGTERDGSGHSRLLVNGLTSVADISAFKGAVGQLTGVRTVSVSSGERGMFIFDVSHDPGADLASAIASLGGFAVRVMEASGDSLMVTVHETAA